MTLLQLNAQTTHSYFLSIYFRD